MEEKKINDGVVRRLFEAPEIRKIDVENRTVDFVASDDSVDSYKTVLPVDKWDLRRYQKNGIVGYMHDVYGDSWTKSADPDDVIGKGVAYVEDGKLLIRITFEPKELNEKADKIFRKIQFGTLNAVSVGFNPTRRGHMGDPEKGEQEGVYYYAGQELLEVSVVNIPSNPNALKRYFGTDVEEIEKERREYENAKNNPAPAPEPDPNKRSAAAVAEDIITIAKARRAMAANN